MKGTTTTREGRTVQAWMTIDLLREIDAAAEALGWSRSQFLVRATRHYLDALRPDNTRPPYQIPAP